MSAWIIIVECPVIAIPFSLMDKEYAQKWFHVKDCLPMVPVFLVCAVLVGLLIMKIS